MSPRPCPNGPVGDCAPPPITAIAVPEGADPTAHYAGFVEGWKACVSHVSKAPDNATWGSFHKIVAHHPDDAPYEPEPISKEAIQTIYAGWGIPNAEQIHTLAYHEMVRQGLIK